jgi:hypothetical protein
MLLVERKDSSRGKSSLGGVGTKNHHCSESKTRLSAYGCPRGSMTNHQQTHLHICLCLLPNYCCVHRK